MNVAVRKLYHYPLDVYGRQVRLYLSEKAVDCELFVRFPWEDSDAECSFSDLPVFVDHDGSEYSGWYAIIEHLEKQGISLLGSSETEKTEVRRIVALFNCSFFAEVTGKIIFEKVIKRYTEKSPPDSAAIRSGNRAIKKYFDYIAWLSDHRNWLAGDDFSLADITAAAHISALDYIGNVEWEKYPAVKDWYVRIKSRPSFRGLLTDHISNVVPPAHYKELDF